MKILGADFSVCFLLLSKGTLRHAQRLATSRLKDNRGALEGNY